MPRELESGGEGWWEKEKKINDNGRKGVHIKRKADKSGMSQCGASKSYKTTYSWGEKAKTTGKREKEKQEGYVSLLIKWTTLVNATSQT